MLNPEVGFTLNNGHHRPSVSAPKSAISGLMHRSNGLFDDLVGQREQH
jgi:hypothetical protein